MKDNGTIFDSFCFFLIFLNTKTNSNLRTMHTLIQGFHEGHPLLYFHDEKHVFFQSHVRSGQVEYTCYEKSRPEQYVTSNEPTAHPKCTAKVVLRRNSIQHQCHANHELIFHDLQTLAAVKEKSRQLSEWLPLSSSKVSANELLAMELAK